MTPPSELRGNTEVSGSPEKRYIYRTLNKRKKSEISLVLISAFDSLIEIVAPYCNSPYINKITTPDCIARGKLMLSSITYYCFLLFQNYDCS